MSRGPKPRTACNARAGSVESIRRETVAAPCELSPAAQAEYERLLDALRSKGTLERVDLVCVAECARVKALLDRAHALVESNGLYWDNAKLIGLLSGQHRGRLRELGLTTQPCRSVVRTPLGSERDTKASKWAGNLKIV